MRWFGNFQASAHRRARARSRSTRPQLWTPAPLPADATPDLRALREAARARVPAEGLGGLIVDAHNALSGHAQPALEAIERWLVGNTLGDEAQAH